MTASSSGSMQSMNQPELKRDLIMPKRRMLSLSRLRPECLQEYVRLHQQVWPELLAAYRQAGITQIGCFLNGLDLIVYSVYESEVYENAKEPLSRNAVEVNWQALTQTLRDPDFEPRTFQEVFHMPSSRDEENAE